MNNRIEKQFIIEGVKINIRLADRPGVVRAWIDINTGNHWIYNCTLVHNDNRFYLNPPQFFDKELVGMPVAENDGAPHDGWVRYADFNSKIEQKRCLKLVLKAYFKMVKEMM